MYKYKQVTLLLVLTILSLVTNWGQVVPVVSAESKNNPVHPTSVVNIPREKIKYRKILKFKPGTDENSKKAVLQDFSGKNIKAYKVNDNTMVAVNVQDDKLKELEANKKILSVEDDFYLGALGVIPNDPEYSNQWYLPEIGFNEKWQEVPANTEEEIVAVIDSGVCMNHPDLSDRLLDGWDFVEQDSIPQDEFNHGCGVAGVIAANTNNSIGISGIAQNVKIMPLRILDSHGLGTYSDLAAAVVYAVDHNAKVINLSLGGYSSSSVLEEAINYAISHKVLVVAAAGNTGDTTLMYPAAIDSVISVGSLNKNGDPSSFSSINPDIDVWAPGEDILSLASAGGYGYSSGTSFSAPIVSGALVFSQNTNTIFPYNGGFILNFSLEYPNKPTLPSITLKEFVDKEYGWSVKYPSNWETPYVAFENKSTDQYVIEKRVMLKEGNNELIAVDIWNNSDKRSTYDSFIFHHKSFIDKDEIPKDVNGVLDGKEAVIVNHEATDAGDKGHQSVIINSGRYTVRLTYSITNGYNSREFKELLKSFRMGNRSGLSNVSILPDNLNVNAQMFFPTCGGYTYNYNQFPCCAGTNQNCTWWGIYARPDLWDKIIIGNAGQRWIDGAISAGINILTTPKVGAIAVWPESYLGAANGHVAYVKGFNNGDHTLHVTQMDCTGFLSHEDMSKSQSGVIGYIDLQNSITLSNYTIIAPASPLDFQAENQIVLNPGTTLGGGGATITLRVN